MTLRQLSIAPTVASIRRAGPLVAQPVAGEAASVSDVSASLRCRLGFHRWLPLALSVPGAATGCSVSFCRSCPATVRMRVRGRA